MPFRSPDNLSKFAASSLVVGRYGGADEERLAAFERDYGLCFSDPYRRFLMRENGLDYAIPHDRIEALPADRKRDAYVLSDINTLFGIGNGHAYFDLEALAPQMGFHDYSLTPYAHVVGLGGDFCTLVEITEGEHAGRVIYTDGELFPGLSRDDLHGKSADAAFEYLSEIGYYSPIAEDFDDLLGKLARLT